MQRRIEREIRKQKRRKTAFEAAGLNEDATAANIKLRRLNQKYKEFSKAAGLPEQRDRIKAYNPLQSSDSSGKIKTGAISGALNPDSDEAEEHAKRYYASVRKMSTDVKRISENTGFPEEEIKKIKNYVFIDAHDLGDLKPKRFFPNYNMARSWQRLIDGKAILPLDITLLNHEAMEAILVESGLSQDEAHIIASSVYNYTKEVDEYNGKTGAYKN